MSSYTKSRKAVDALFSQQPLPLGLSLPPNNEHALSVSMPLWEDVVGYEEGDADVLNALASGYPRFFRHPSVKELEQKLKNTLLVSATFNAPEVEWHVMIMPTIESAQRLHSFLTTQSDSKPSDPVAIHTFLSGSLYAVSFPMTLYDLAYRCWQHAGEIVSSRHAQWALRQLTNDTNGDEQLQWRGTATHEALCTRLAALYHTDTLPVESQHVFLYPTGMACIFAALRLILLRKPHGKVILFGFPYLDTLKLLERTQWCPHGVHFFPKGSEDDLQQVKTLLETEAISAIFTEFPSNPLLSLPDLERLAELAHVHGSVLVVDDTIGSFNINPFQGNADIVMTSLAKIFSGTCTAMAGSLVLNPKSDAFKTFHESLVSTNDSFLYEEDAATLLAASEDLQPRLAQINASTAIIVERLSRHPLVKSLYYPSKQQQVENFHRLMTNTPSEKPRYGPMFSCVLHGGESAARVFYDELNVAKGPSLGTNFTLVCPYTIIAHYKELDYVESCGLDRYLIRFSIGLEDVEWIWQAIEKALSLCSSEKRN